MRRNWTIEPAQTEIEKINVLNDLETWLLTQSLAKQGVIGAVAAYARDNLIPVSRLPSLFGGTDPSRYNTVNAILAKADLPDLLFLKTTMALLQAIPQTSSSLRDRVLPVTRTYKEALKTPYVQQIQKIAAAVFVMGLFTRYELTLLALASFLFADQLVELRIQRELNRRLAEGLGVMHVTTLALGDGLDEWFERMAIASGHVLAHAGENAVRLFESGVPAPRARVADATAEQAPAHRRP